MLRGDLLLVKEFVGDGSALLWCQVRCFGVRLSRVMSRRASKSDNTEVT